MKFAKSFQNEKALYIGIHHESNLQLEFSYETTRFISSKLMDCFISLSDWESASEWLKEFESIVLDINDRKKISNFIYSGISIYFVHF